MINCIPFDRPRAMRDVLIESIDKIMSIRGDIFFLSADFGSPALDGLRANHPGKFINVGIAEQNLVNVATGLALEGNVVFAYAIAPFITMRCYEQIRVNLSVLAQVRPAMNVNLVGVGAGLSYDVSGPTHHCLEDISIMRVLPGIEVISPGDPGLCPGLAEYCIGNRGVKYLRLDGKPLPSLAGGSKDLDPRVGYARYGTSGKVAVLSTGFMTQKVSRVLSEDAMLSEEVDFFDICWLTSINEEVLAKELSSYRVLLTIEEGFIGRGGLDAFVRDLSFRRMNRIPVHSMGILPGYTYEMGTREDLHEHLGIGLPDIRSRLKGLASEGEH